jgi:hypothetical protein
VALASCPRCLTPVSISQNRALNESLVVVHAIARRWYQHGSEKPLYTRPDSEGPCIEIFTSHGWGNVDKKWSLQSPVGLYWSPRCATAS